MRSSEPSDRSAEPSHGAVVSKPASAREKPLRVLHVCAPGPVGGLESVVLGLAIGHRRQGVESEVVALLDEGSTDTAFVDALREARVPVYTFRLKPRAYLKERRLLRDVIQRRGPHVVHTHGHRIDVLDADVARRMGVPTVTTIHGSSLLNWRTRLYEKLQFRLLPRFDLVLPVAQDLIPELRAAGVPEERIRLVPNAWDGRHEPLPRPEARRALELPSDVFAFGWVGRLIPVKGADLFLEALRPLRASPFRASIIGEGPERQALERLTDESGLRERVWFHGRVDTAARLYSAFDAFVLSSRSEGAPMVLFEAMAAGVPIIAARVGGVGDILSEREAWLVPPERPSELAAALAEAMSDPAARERKAAAARERLRERFSTESWLARHEELYQEIVRNRSAR